MSKEAAARQYLGREPLLHADMRAVSQRGNMALEVAEGKGVLLYNKEEGVALVSAVSAEVTLALLDAAGPFTDIALHQPGQAEAVCARYGLAQCFFCCQSVYEKPVPLAPPGGIVIRPIGPEYLDTVCAHYHHADKAYLLRRLRDGMYGAFIKEELAGFVGVHAEGSIGMLEVLPAYRRRGVGYALCVHMTNIFVRKGQLAFSQIHPDNTASLALQHKLGYQVSGPCVAWLHTAPAGQNG